MRYILVTNTMTGKKEEFKEIEPGHVRMYACGVTVYDDCHIGHAMQAVFFDMIRSYLEYRGFRVTYVRNYTDVDDKIIQRALELGIAPLDLSSRVIETTQRDMKNLGVREATYEPRVSESILEIIAMVEALITSGNAYATKAGDVYYRVRSKKDYGKLSNRKPDDMRSGARDVQSTEKEDELDFALWKQDVCEGASWESPWGRGRPGWHIECSAMGKKYLGEHFDIHGGGRDLIFPHHENEIAQSESANQKPYANYWLHSGLLTINKQKMSKSLGNQITIASFLEKWPAEVLRLAYLIQHYTSNIDFTPAVFKLCASRLLYYYETLKMLDDLAGTSTDNHPLVDGYSANRIVESFHKSMSDDFNSVAAISDLNIALKKANELAKVKKAPARANTAFVYAQTFRELFNVLGLLKEDPSSFMERLKDKVLPDLGITRTEIEAAILERNAARKARDFTRSDEIRSHLADRGIELMDTATETRWSLILSSEAL